MGGFGQIMHNMLTWQPSGSPAWQRQQQTKIAQAQEARAAQKADLDFHEHMMEIGALPVVNGMVKEQQPLTAPAAAAPDQSQSSAAPSSYSDDSTAESGGDASQAVDPALTRGGYTPAAPTGGGSPVNFRELSQTMSQPGPSGSPSSLFDAEGNPNPAATFGTPGTSQQIMQAMMPGPQTGNVSIVRKADPAATVKWKDSTGDTVAYELPSVESQRWNQMMRARAQALQQQTAAQEQGRLDAQNRQRDQYGTPLSGDLAAQYGVDPDQKFLPMEKVQLATRYFPVVGAGIRGNATTNAAQIRADAATYKADLDNTTKQAISDQNSMDRQNLLDHRDKWNQAIVAAKNNGQGNLNARAFLNGSARDMALHATLLGNISKENQRQMLAQSLLATGPDGQPVTKDGDQFPDPFSGRTLTMNSAQRIRLGSALQQSQSTVSGYQQAAAELESRRDQILNRFGGGTSAPGAAPSSPAAPSPQASPTAGAPTSSTAPLPSRPPIFNGATTTGPGTTPTGRPPNWADAGRRASAAGETAAPGTPTKPPQKIATKAQVNVYAAQKKITPAAAMKEFQASGYTVQ